MTFSLSELEKKVNITNSGACLGEKKFWQLSSSGGPENQAAITLHLGSASLSLNCFRHGSGVLAMG